MGYLWCTLLQMWCDDVEEDYYDSIRCDGCCRSCHLSECITPDNEEDDY